MDSSSTSTQNSLGREGIKIDKDNEEIKARLELEPALPAKVRRERASVVFFEKDKCN